MATNWSVSQAKSQVDAALSLKANTSEVTQGLTGGPDGAVEGIAYQDPQGLRGFTVGPNGVSFPYDTEPATETPAADVRLPADTIVRGPGGYLRVNRPADPVSSSPHSKLPAVIEYPITRSLVQNYKLVPAIALVGSRIWVAWYGINTTVTHTPIGEMEGTYATVAYSDDLGVTWTPAFVIAAADESWGRVWDMTFAEINGRLWIRYGYNRAFMGGTPKGFLDGYSGCWSFFVNNPLADRNFIFSKQKFSRPGLSYNVFEIDGLKYVPRSYTQAEHGGKMTEEFGRWIDRLHDDGSLEPWMLMPSAEPSNQFSWDERQIVQIGQEGRLLAQWRSLAGIYQSVFDGSSWSAPAVWTGITPNPVSKHFLGRSPTGRLVCVLNASTGRNNLTIALSEDEGATWPVGKRKLLYAGDSSYPVVAFDAQGRIIVVYDASRGPTVATDPSVASIRMSIVDEELVASGTSTVTNRIISMAGA